VSVATTADSIHLACATELQLVERLRNPFGSWKYNCARYNTVNRQRQKEETRDKEKQRIRRRKRGKILKYGKGKSDNKEGEDNAIYIIYRDFITSISILCKKLTLIIPTSS
jgi:hypothetical protein